jgi:hypothetical protein
MVHEVAVGATLTVWCGALGGIRQNHTSTIERYPSLPELMAAVYDRSPAMAVLLEYVLEYVKYVLVCISYEATK